MPPTRVCASPVIFVSVVALLGVDEDARLAPEWLCALWRPRCPPLSPRPPFCPARASVDAICATQRGGALLGPR